MISFIAVWAAIAALALVAVFARRAPDIMAARRIGISGAIVALVLAGLSAAWRMWSLPELVEAPHLSFAATELWIVPLPLYMSVIGFTAIAMSSARRHRPVTISRIALVIAASMALIEIQHPIALAPLWLLTVVPVYLELRSNPTARDIDRVFAIYMFPATALAMVGSLLLGTVGGLIGLAPLALAIAIREAMVPVHSWFPAVVDRAPMGLVVAFVCPQLGVYTHLRWIAEGLPIEIGDSVAALGAVTAIFAALMGAVQSRARRALGYLMMSQTALVAFGLVTHSAVARAGTLVAWAVAGVATAGFAMTFSALQSRRGELDLDHPGGNYERIPLLAGAFLVLGLASVGLPGTLGFVAEDLLVQGSADDFPMLALALIVATAINGITVMRSFFCLFTGVKAPVGERDLTRREWMTLTIVLAALLTAGVWPGPVVKWLGEIGGESSGAHGHH